MRLPAEFEPQSFVQLTWPHRDTDWAEMYDEVIECYCNMAREIASRQPLLIVAQHPNDVIDELRQHGISTDNIRIVGCKTNDTWARDHAFITCTEQLSDGKSIPYYLDFQFNGWGMKFAANHDNQVNRNIYDAEVIKGTYINHLDFVLEGGSIESDGLGTILTTSSCLLAPNRNIMTRAEVEMQLCEYLGADRILWLEHSWLAGDDTDGHVDTVARFCSADTIAYCKCYDTNDEHYAELSAMEAELREMRTSVEIPQPDGTVLPAGSPYRLVPLPLPRPCYDPDDTDSEGNPQRLPATYANFLIMDKAVLVPTYGQDDLDRMALNALVPIFPDREIVGIDCQVLIRQHGSLHCSTMQFPAT